MIKLRCDMHKDCKRKIAFIDRKGYLYCRKHVVTRAMYVSCRRLTDEETKTLESGNTIRY